LANLEHGIVMPTLHVCSLARLRETATDIGARHLVTLINDGTPVVRPPDILSGRHLVIGINDIAHAQEGLILAGEDHVGALVSFVTAWDQTHQRNAPLLFHCWAGVSRSTAAAYIASCFLQPDVDESELAMHLRKASPTATPNPRLVALADEMLKRRGRMVAAIAAIGRGADCYEGAPFTLPLGSAKMVAAS
jgi:predicted protein tyrosine phosphatase